MKTIYISGRITGLIESEYKEAFKFAQEVCENDVNAQLLKSNNEVCQWQPINPLNIGEELEKTFNSFGEVPTWRDYMGLDIIELVKCDAIYMSKGWEQSKGARLEHHIANELGLEVYHQKIIM
mgnify:CR=1 FL=1